MKVLLVLFVIAFAFSQKGLFQKKFSVPGCQGNPERYGYVILDFCLPLEGYGLGYRYDLKDGNKVAIMSCSTDCNRCSEAIDPSQRIETGICIDDDNGKSIFSEIIDGIDKVNEIKRLCDYRALPHVHAMTTYSEPNCLGEVIMVSMGSGWTSCNEYPCKYQGRHSYGSSMVSTCHGY